MLAEKLSNIRLSQSLSKVASGDMSGLADIYERLGKQIFALAFSILNDRHDAEDAMQDTFVKLARYAHSYDQSGPARAWIMATARNAALDIAHERQRNAAGSEEELENVTDGSDIAAACEVNAMLETLEETDRHIVILRAANGYAFGEIGEVIGITAEAARKRYARAIRKLKDEFS